MCELLIIIKSMVSLIFYYFLPRPIAGHANLCPRSISTKLPELDVLISTVKHEILHALGFSVSLFAFYRDSRGLPLTPRDEHGKPALNEKYIKIFSLFLIYKKKKKNGSLISGKMFNKWFLPLYLFSSVYKRVSGATVSSNELSVPIGWSVKAACAKKST